MRLLIAGAGATGGYFGGRLAQAGRDVTFLVRPKRAAELRTNGLRIISPNGDVTLAPRLVTAGEIDGSYDAVLVTVKAYGLPQVMEDFAPAVGPRTMIIPILNGMKHLDILAARFGGQAVIGGVCKIASTLDQSGRIVQSHTFHDLIYGELDGASSSRIRALDEFMRGAGFDAKLSLHITRELWEKWTLLASLGAITCLMRGTIGEVEAVPGGRAFALSVLAEVTAVVSAAGEAPSEAYLDQIRTLLTAKESSQASSMFRDLRQNFPIEADHIIGDLIARARKVNLDTPLLDIVYSNLSVYQNQLMSGRN